MDPSYDVLIVGAGSSGTVLAARLSEDGSRRVLLLDDGPWFTDESRPERVRDVATVPSRAADREWTTWYDAEVAGRVVSVPRGRLVGGSSAVNGGYFIRGTMDDFDGWAALGNDEWSYDRVLPVLRRLERDADFGDRGCHGDQGPITVRRATPAEHHPVSVAFLDASEGLGHPYEEDKNAPGRSGVGPVPCNAVDGVRLDVASTYLTPVLDRPNLTVRGGVRVRRVVIERGRAIGVEVDAGRTSRVLRAEQVVLSAGAVTSAHLLMLSGIGPATELLAQGVEVVVDAPGVGRLWDHPALDVVWTPTWAASGDAPPLTPGPNFQVALHTDDVELLPMVRPYGVANGESPDDRHLALRVGLQRVTLPGRVRLASSNPHVPPDIVHRYLEDPDDLARGCSGVRLAVEVLKSRPFASLLSGRSGPSDAELRDDRELRRWLLANVGTSMHSSGTCAMGPDDDEMAVVDQWCAVRGVDGLRVVDTSIMPTLITRGTAATAVMIGERAAELLD